MLKAVCIMLGVAVNALPADIELAPNGRGTNFATIGGSVGGCPDCPGRPNRLCPDCPAIVSPGYCTGGEEFRFSNGACTQDRDGNGAVDSLELTQNLADAFDILTDPAKPTPQLAAFPGNIQDNKQHVLAYMVNGTCPPESVLSQLAVVPVLPNDLPSGVGFLTGSPCFDEVASVLGDLVTLIFDLLGALSDAGFFDRFFRDGGGPVKEADTPQFLSDLAERSGIVRRSCFGSGPISCESAVSDMLDLFQPFRDNEGYNIIRSGLIAFISGLTWWEWLIEAVALTAQIIGATTTGFLSIAAEFVVALTDIADLADEIVKLTTCFEVQGLDPPSAPALPPPSPAPAAPPAAAILCGTARPDCNTTPGTQCGNALNDIRTKCTPAGRSLPLGAACYRTGVEDPANCGTCAGLGGVSALCPFANAPCKQFNQAGDFTCGERIFFEINDMGLGLNAACDKVAKEFPGSSRCGGCITDSSCFFDQPGEPSGCLGNVCALEGDDPCDEDRFGGPQPGGNPRCRTVNDESAGAACCDGLGTFLVPVPGAPPAFRCLPMPPPPP